MTTITGDGKEPTAQYYHGTLYVFTPIARAAVIAEFYSKVSNIEAVCSYNTKKHLFSLSCPSSQGAFCDETLGEIINIYIERELKAAVRDGRAVEVQRFPESRLDWAEDEGNGEQHAVIERTPTEPQIRARAVKAHTVSIRDPEGSRLKFFRMEQLPKSFTSRALTPATIIVQDIFITGLTCRAVQWKAGEGYIFNGRDGASLIHDTSSCREQVKLTIFPELRDTRDESTLNELNRKAAEGPPISRRRYVGPGPGVREWLHDVDQTTQIGPEEAADLPKETRKLIAADEMNVIGRARLPKNYKLGTQDRDDSSDDEPSRSVSKAGFAAVMLSGASGSVPNSPDSDSSSKSGHTTTAATGGLHTPPPTTPLSKHQSTNSQEKISVQPTLASPKGASNRTGPASPVWTKSSTAPSPKLHSSLTPSVVQDTTEFVQYEKKYAKVDPSGLTADPHLSAKWQLENLVPLTSTLAKPQAIMPRFRQPYTQGATESSTASTRAASELSSPSASTQSRNTASPRQQAEAVVSEPRKQDTGRQKDQKAQLRDITSTHSLRPMAAPPGLMQPQIQHTKNRPTPQANSTNLNEVPNVGRMDTVPPRMSNAVISGSPPTIKLAVSRHTNGSSDVKITDKLAVVPSSFDSKRSTMSLKAGHKATSKGKGKKSANTSGKKPKVDLPKPDPLPAPRMRKVPEILQRGLNAQRYTPARALVQHEEQPLSNAFQQLLLDNMEKLAKPDSDEANLARLKAQKLVVQFGQLFLVAEEKSLSKQEASPPEVMQDLLTSSTVKTHFFPRLTTSESDANLLINMIGAGTVSEVIYELRIRDAADMLLICSIAGDEKSCFEIRTADHALGYEYLHYPIHVWDARTTLLQPGVEYESTSHKAIEHFIASMETKGQAPSFCAYVPFGQFVVEAVYALRIFENNKDGITRRVTEKRLLKQEPFSGVKHNLEALARFDEDLINDQCLWWEAKLETDDMQKREELLDMAAFVVENIDDVGVKNIGPWRVREKDEGEENAAPPLLYDQLGRDYLARLKA